VKREITSEWETGQKQALNPLQKERRPTVKRESREVELPANSETGRKESTLRLEASNPPYTPREASIHPWV